MHEIIDVRRYDIEVGIRDAEPLRQRRRELVGGGRRDHAAPAYVVITAELEQWIRAEDVAAVDGAADDNLVTTPGMIGAITVRGQRAAEIRLRKRRHAVGNAEFDGRIVKCRHRVIDTLQQSRLILILIIVGVEAAGPDKEDLPLHAQLIP